MKKQFNFIYMATAVLLLAACHSTRIVNSWRDPQVTVDTSSLHKVLVAALLKNETVRRQVEDEMASLLPGKAVQSYKEFGMSELKGSDDAYNEQLTKNGYDGIVMMRIASIDSTTRLVQDNYPPYYYGGWRRYWAMSWLGYYQPSHYTTDQTYNIEVTVYSLHRDKFIWTANSTAINPPENDTKAYNNISKEVYKRMRDEGFFK